MASADGLLAREDIVRFFGERPLSLKSSTGDYLAGAQDPHAAPAKVL